MICRHLLFLLVFLIHPSLRASEHRLEHLRGNITIPQIQGWEIKEKVFGMPYMLFSPQTKGQRSNISFTHSGIDFPFKVSEIEKSLRQYQDLKKEWTRKIGAEYIKVHEHQRKENLLGHTLYVFGFEYEHQKKHYVEKTYLIQCRGEMVYAKSLRLNENEEHEAKFDKFLNLLNCS